MQMQFQQGNQATQQPPHFKQLPQQQQNLTKMQDKIFSLNSLNQKGAFIPLQVSRGNNSFSNNGQAATTSSNNQIDSPSNRDVIVQNVNIFN